MVKFRYRHEESNAARAQNWRAVLLVDLLMGLAVIAGGAAAIVWWSAIVGWILVALGMLYVFALIGRYQAWRNVRREQGIDG
jgi:thiosulfate reductase cytochrome b subunit